MYYIKTKLFGDGIRHYQLRTMSSGVGKGEAKTAIDY